MVPEYHNNARNVQCNKRWWRWEKSWQFRRHHQGRVHRHVFRPATTFTNDVLDGFKMAAEKINAKGGVLGRKITYVTRDDKFKPDIGLTMAKELILNENVDLLVGTINSATALAVSDLCRMVKVPFFATFAKSDKITGEKGHRYVFGMNENTEMVGRAAVGFVLERGFFSYLYEREHLMLLLLTFAFMLILGDLVKIVWGPEYRSVTVPAFFQGSAEIFGLPLPWYNLFLLLVGPRIAVFLWLVINRTNLGKIARAYVIDNGRILYQGKAKDFEDNAEIQRMQLMIWRVPHRWSYPLTVRIGEPWPALSGAVVLEPEPPSHPARVKLAKTTLSSARIFLSDPSYSPLTSMGS